MKHLCRGEAPPWTSQTSKQSSTPRSPHYDQRELKVPCPGRTAEVGHLTTQKQPMAMTVGSPRNASAIAAHAQKAMKSRVAEGSCQVMQACRRSSWVATSSSRFCRVRATPSSRLYLRLRDATALVLPLSSCTHNQEAQTAFCTARRICRASWLSMITSRAVH